jgi:hypothetical protein
MKQKKIQTTQRIMRSLTLSLLSFRLNTMIAIGQLTANPAASTSALSHKRTWRLQFAMSALPLKADIRIQQRNVRFVP